MPYYPTDRIKDKENDLPYDAIANKEPMKVANEGMSVRDFIAEKYQTPQIAKEQAESDYMSNLGRSFQSFSRGVNAPQSSDDLYANMEKQTGRQLDLVKSDIERANQVKEAIANRGFKDQELARKQLDDQRDYELRKRQLDIAASDKETRNELARMKAELAKESKQQVAKTKAPSELNASDKARYDNVKMASDSINGMVGALNKGQSRYSLLGDNDFTQNLTLFSEAVGRMQSGGAINKDEEARFIKMARSAFDDSSQTQKKLTQLKQIMDDRMSTLGQEAVPTLGFKKPGKNGEVSEVTANEKVIVRRGYNPKNDQTQLVYSDGTKEVVNGKR